MQRAAEAAGKARRGRGVGGNEYVDVNRRDDWTPTGAATYCIGTHYGRNP